MEIKEKNIKIQESVYITYSTMQILYSYYKHNLPSKLSKKLYSVLVAFENEYTKQYLSNEYDITDISLYEKVTFEKK